MLENLDIGYDFGTLFIGISFYADNLITVRPLFIGILFYADNLITVRPTRRGIQKLSILVTSLLNNMMFSI